MKLSTQLAASVLAVLCCGRASRTNATASGRATDANVTGETPPGTVTPAQESYYQLRIVLLGQDAAQVGLDVHRGHPTLVSMFYGSCKFACPLLISNIRAIEARLPPAQREELRVLLVSFDGANDTPDALRQLASDQHLDSRWLLASANEDDARTLAAGLGVQYRRLPNGGFAHNSVLTLLDRDGAARGTTELLNPPPDGFVVALAAELRTSARVDGAARHASDGESPFATRP